MIGRALINKSYVNNYRLLIDCTVFSDFHYLAFKSHKPGSLKKVKFTCAARWFTNRDDISIIFCVYNARLVPSSRVTLNV